MVFQLLCFVYLPALNGPFMFDDFGGIVENADLRHPAELGRLLGDHRNSLEFDRRPVTGLLTVLNFQLAGLSPPGYRVVNLLLHLLTGVVLSHLLTALGRRFGMRTPRLFGFGVALIWLFHPLATSAVSYIYQRSEVLMSLFYLSALACVLRAGSAPHSGRWLAAGGGCAVLSALSKEPGLTLLATLPLMERLVVFDSWGVWWRRRRVFYLWLSLALLALVMWLASGVRMTELKDGSALATPFGYFRYQCDVLVRYLRLVFWPSGMVFFSAPRPGIALARWLPALLFLVLLFGSLLLAARKRKWLGLGAGAFLLLLAPTSSFVPIPLEPEAEFRMYLPSAFVLALTVASAGMWLPPLRARWQRVVLALVALTGLGALGAATFHRNWIMGSSSRLWADVVTKDPLNGKAWGNLAFVSLANGDLEGARQCGLHLIELSRAGLAPGYEASGRRILAGVDLERGDTARALPVFEELARTAPDLPGLWMDYSLALARSARYQDAWELVLHQAPDWRHATPAAAALHAELHLRQGDLAAAQPILAELQRIAPGTRRVRELESLAASAATHGKPATEPDPALPQ